MRSAGRSWAKNVDLPGRLDVVKTCNSGYFRQFYKKSEFVSRKKYQSVKVLAHTFYFDIYFDIREPSPTERSSKNSSHVTASGDIAGSR